jgi:hypothetical protein
MRYSTRSLLALTALFALGMYLSVALGPFFFLAAVPYVAIMILLAIDKAFWLGIVIGAATAFLIANAWICLFLLRMPEDFGPYLTEALPGSLAIFGTCGGVIGGVIHAVKRGRKECLWLLVAILFDLVFVMSFSPIQ